MALRPLPPPRDDDPVGTLRLEGQVIDGADAPVAGARVALDTAPPREVVTEADGAFAFTGLLARDYEVAARTDDGVAGPVRLRLTDTTEPVTLRLAAAGSVEVTVTAAEGGAPIAGAAVELRASPVARAVTGADGVALLRGIGASWAPVAARAEGFAPAAVMVSTSGVGDAPIRVALALTRGAAIAGIVVDDAGAPIAGARVHASNVAEPLPVVDPRADAVTTDAAGRFVVPALAAGSWRLEARHGDHAPTQAPPITVDGIHPRSDVRLVMGAGGVVRGCVVDDAGAPVAAADVQLVADGHVAWRPRRAAYTDADGRFEVTGLPRRAVDVVAWHPRGASAIQRVDLTATRTADVTLTLAHAGELGGVVVDEAGQAIGDAVVELTPSFGGGPELRAAWAVRGAPAAITDQGGQFRFQGLPAGGYQVSTRRPGAAAGPPGASVAATTGDLALRLVIAADGVVRGRVVLAPGGAFSAFTVAVGDGPRRAGGGGDGAFAVAAAAGRYPVTIAGPGFVEKLVPDVEITAGATTDLGTIEVTPGRAISGRVLAADGTPVDGAQVAVGALLSGGGDSLYIADESLGARETRTDVDGRFVLDGFGPGSLVVLAGKDGLGRSASVRVPPGGASVTLELVLEPSATLRGRVVRGGAPLPDTIVIANPIGATSANFFVTTGADGGFAFAALAPAPYVVYAMIGGGGGQPKDLYTRGVDVALGAEATVTLDATPGPLALTVDVRTDAGGVVPMAQVMVIEGLIEATTVDELRDGTRMPLGDATLPVFLRYAVDGPAEVVGVRPGVQSVCVAALLNPLADPSGLPVRCEPVTLPASPPAQRVAVTVPAAWLQAPTP
ncbi:MAG: carboxypeptidase regulatory-like domain-containing protein [Kofleriaceae bacterium]